MKYDTYRTFYEKTNMPDLEDMRKHTQNGFNHLAKPVKTDKPAMNRDLVGNVIVIMLIMLAITLGFIFFGKTYDGQ